MSRPVRLVALAARTPVGLTAEATAAAVRAGISRITMHPIFADANGDPVRCGYDATLGPDLHGGERMTALVRPVLADLARALTGERTELARVPVLLALPDARPGFGAEDRRRVVQALAAARVPGIARLEVRESGGGHAGALAGVAQAAGRISRSEADLCIVAGLDSYLEGRTIDWLEESRLLDREGIRGGFPPGEGAAMVALASDAGRQRLGLSSLATVRSAACENEERDPDGPEGPLGEALTRAFISVAASLRRPGERIDDLYCDVNGERPRVTDLGFALMRTAEFFRAATDYRTAAGRVGDLGAPTGALS